MGARAYRVLFAAVSLPLAVVAVVYFINHRYDGVPLWNLRGLPGVHSAVFAANFVSFFFLYPSTFNLLEARPCRKRGSVLQLSLPVLGSEPGRGTLVPMPVPYPAAGVSSSQAGAPPAGTGMCAFP